MINIDVSEWIKTHLCFYYNNHLDLNVINSHRVHCELDCSDFNVSSTITNLYIFHYFFYFSSFEINLIKDLLFN